MAAKQETTESQEFEYSASDSDPQPTAYALIRMSDNVVDNIIYWNGLGEGFVPDGQYSVMSMDARIGWTYTDGKFVPPPPTEEEISTANSSLLQQNTAMAAMQKTALTNRVSTLQDAVELEMATDEEVAELPVRQKQLTEWKKYAVYLGRVTAQPGWALTVTWPDQPKEGMDLSVSASSTSAPTS